ncbi:FecR family protein [Sphingopyxis alaskensis]|jgi:transmembrane sensor|uniref:FecR family protein n=1 Tax=Sphingopyxis alaskensis TaxID=117207 RepID=UPI00203C9186|nr:FecR domain-containing protein [Sphingopyxis alaskensis]MCM3420950.1 FecR domain-containing protein [Sphingopyxis alaskensis]
MSDDEPQNLASNDTIMAEATRWFGRMRGPEAEQHKAEFERWLARGALHRSFYNRAGEIYAMGKFLKDEQEQNAGQSGEWDAETNGVDRATGENRPGARVRRGVLVSLILVVAITIGFAALSSRTITDNSPEYAQTGTTSSSFRLVTKTGQVLSQRLADGSRVTLNADTSLLVYYDDAQRTLRLERGTSRFEVAHEKRPFVVLAGDGRITARGTIFEVGLRRDRHVTVRLLQGKIDVAAPGPAGKNGAVRHLNAGESLSYPAATPVTMRVPVAMAEARTAVDAQPSDVDDAYEEFDGAALATVVDLANRRGARAIRLASSDLDGLKVSGRFRLNDPEKLARKVALLFNLEVGTGPENEIILRSP